MAAAKSGALETLQWAVTIGLELYEDVFDAAALSGNIAILNWLRNKCDWKPSIWTSAALGGHTNVFLWLQNDNKFGTFPRTACVEAAIKSHNLDMFQLVYTVDTEKSNSFLTTAISEKQWEIVSILLKDGYNITNVDCPIICRSGNFTLLLQAHTLNCSIDGYCLTEACYSGNMEMVQWIRSLGITFGYRSATAAAAQSQNFELLKWLFQDGCSGSAGIIAAAVRHNNMEILQWALDINGTIGSEDVNACAEVGNLEVMEILWKKQRSQVSCASFFDAAVRGGHLRMIQWARNHYIPWSKSVSNAVPKDRIDILEWLNKNGFFKGGLAYDALDLAASNGNLLNVKWLVEQLDASMAYFPYNAMYNGHLNVLKYLYAKKKFQITQDAYLAATSRCNHPRVVKWIKECYANKC